MTTIRRRVPRPTIRTRLAALYALVFLVAGGALLGVTYALMHDAISKQQISLAVLSDADFTTARADPTAERQRVEKIELYQQMVRDDFRREVVNSMTRSLAVALVVLVFVGFGFGWFVARHSLRPVQQITDAARRVAGGRFEERVALRGPRDEIRELADTFDDMVRRLAAAFDSQRRFVANASHELRTPLTINRTLLEVAMGRPDSPAQLRELGAALLQVNERQHAMIDGLLALAESEQRLAGTVPVDLGGLIRVSVGALQPEADQRGITVIVGETDASVDADPELLERLTMNLVQNAIRHNRAHGQAWVSCATTSDAVELHIANTGPSVPEDRIQELFEPFRRGTARVGSPRGHGLGLSIVRAVALAHGGSISARPRDDGGLVVVVTLPRRAGQHSGGAQPAQRS